MSRDTRERTVEKEITFYDAKTEGIYRKLPVHEELVKEITVFFLFPYKTVLTLPWEGAFIKFLDF